MLLDLEYAIPTIKKMVLDSGIWDSLIINRRKPHTWRLFSPLGDNRICLHKFAPCEDFETFAHPHPWPAAFLVLQGSYKQNIGYSLSSESNPIWHYREIMTAGCRYEITDWRTWHSIQPLEETYTIMLNGPPHSVQHKDTRTTKGKDLDQMLYPDGLELLDKFQELLKDY